MLIEFSIGNFRSFKDVQTISFRATGLISDVNNRSIDDTNIMDVYGHRLLKSIGVYGPNSSGKSNLIRGIAFFQNMVANSLDKEGILKQYTDRFKMSEKWMKGSFFQAIFLIEGKRYRYGFSVDTDIIESEWLFGPAEKNETYYFKRNGEDVDVNGERFEEGSDIPIKEKLRKDALFLTFASSYKGVISGAIRSFICDKILIDKSSGSMLDVIAQINASSYSMTNQLIKDNKKEIVLSWLKEAGMIFQDVVINTAEIDKTNFIEFVLLSKNVYDQEGQVTSTYPMWLTHDESAGTRKFYEYIGQLHQLFEQGGVYISDEIDNNFHPYLLRKILNLFHSTHSNSGLAQLLFTSHDTNLLNPNLMRRDQFYFTEKTTMEWTKLYSLADLKGIRNNADFATQYLSGMYGALPILENLLECTDQEKQIQNTN